MRRMRSITTLILSVSLVGCDGVGIGDNFTYNSKVDEFTGMRVSEALTDVKSDTDKSAKLQVAIRCKYSDKTEPDPFRSTTLELTVTDAEGNPKDFSSMTLKFDDMPPPDNGYLQQNNISKYTNVSEHGYASMAILMLPPKQRIAPMMMMTFGFNKENAYKLVKAAINAESMMVRYETDGGLISTNTISINGSN